MVIMAYMYVRAHGQAMESSVINIGNTHNI